MKIILYLLILTGGVIISFAQDNKPQRSIEEIVNMPVVYRVAGMEKIETRTNLKYTGAKDPNLLMDVYLPANKKMEKKCRSYFLYTAGRARNSRRKIGEFTNPGDALQRLREWSR